MERSRLEMFAKERQKSVLKHDGFDEEKEDFVMN